MISLRSSPSGYSLAKMSYTGISLGTPTADTPGVFDAAGSTMGTTSTLSVNNVDPNEMDAPGTVCYWSGLISSNFSYTTNAQVQIRLRCSSTPNDAWKIVLGVFDGTAATAQGIYTALRANDGWTGGEQFGTLPAVGNGAGSLVTKGGTKQSLFSCDGDNDRMRNLMTTTSGGPGPAFGWIARSENPASWAGTELHWFFALTGAGALAAGVFADVTLDYMVLPLKT
jgi:hypothetical protein